METCAVRFAVDGAGAGCWGVLLAWFGCAVGEYFYYI
jgi:hypothetical protein